MKKIILLFTLVISFFVAIAQPIHKEDRQTIVFQFNKLNIIVSNHGTIDPLLNATSPYRQFPFPEKGFTVYGFYMKILITETDQPFLDTYSPTRVIIDTSSADAKLMRVEDLEILDTFYIQRSSPFTKRQDIKTLPQQTSPGSYPFSIDSIFRSTTYYIVLKGQFSVDVMRNQSLTFRNKHTKQNLLRLNLIGVERPILPALETWLQDTSHAYRDLSLDKYRPYYGTIPTERELLKLEQEDTGIKLRNEKMQKTVLAFYFRKGVSYDNQMEYRLQKVSNTNADTVWHRTGNPLLLTQLEHSESYKLLVRYSVHPKYIQEYTFYIEPKWYQTTKFKIFVFFGCAFIGLAFVFAKYRLRERTVRKKKDLLTLELKSIRSQLNPHFVFNAMNSIQGLINKNDIPSANYYLTEFSNLLRESLRNNDKEMAPLITEISLLETYLKLEQLRFHFQYSIITDQAINQSAIEIPALLLQPLVENAVKHGIASLQDKGTVIIRFESEGQSLHVLISDNGVGFNGQVSENGLGLKLTRDRIQLLNQTLKKQLIGIKFKRMPTNGTTVYLSFENWL